MYGPNVLIAFIGAAGFFIMVLSLLAHPRYSLRRELARLEGREQEGGFLARLQRKLDQADIPISAGEFLRMSTMLGVAVGLGTFVLTGIASAGLMGFALGFFIYWSYLEDRRDKRRIAYQEALAEVVDILQEAFAATHSLLMAIDTLAEHAPEPAREDFREISRRLHVGESLPDVLQEVAARRREIMFDRLVEALIANMEEGGELGPVLRALAKAVRGMARVRRQVAAAQSKIRWEARVVCIAPFVFMIILRFTAATLQRPFYASIWGQLAALAVGFLSAGAYYIMNRMGRKALAIVESAGIRQ